MPCRLLLVLCGSLFGCAGQPPASVKPVPASTAAPPPAPPSPTAEAPATDTGRPKSSTVGQVGDPAHRFFLRPSNPKRSGVDMVDLNQWVGPRAKTPHRVLLSFAAFYCQPCKVELRAYTKHADALRGTGVKVVVVLMDEDKESRDKMEAFLRDIELPFPMVPDAFQIIARKYGVQSLPHNVLIDPDGTIRWVKSGYQEGLSMPQLLTAIGR